MLSCHSLGKTYRTERGVVEAVHGINLDVAAGRYAAIVGRSGSGKSSLMAMIGGLSRPTSGSIMIDGMDIWSLGIDAMAQFRNQHIGYIFQFASLLPTLRALDNVALPILLDRSADKALAYDRAAQCLADVGLGAHIEAYPAELSAGEQKRTAIARALVNNPVLLLADEPTSDLDEQTEREIMALLLRIHHGQEITLVLVTHNLTLAGGADQVIHIANGTTVA